jgi:hypothetical protein
MKKELINVNNLPRKLINDAREQTFNGFMGMGREGGDAQAVTIAWLQGVIRALQLNNYEVSKLVTDEPQDSGKAGSGTYY